MTVPTHLFTKGISIICLSVFATSEIRSETPALIANSTLSGASGGTGVITRSIHHILPLALPSPQPRADLPAIFSPTSPRKTYATYPWKNDIVTTVFWVGEKPTVNNPTPNTASSWDPRWTENFGGYDDPDPEKRKGWLPKKFTPRENPFYIALPYNDTAKLKTKASARKYVPWFDKAFYRDGKSVLKGRWLAIRRGDKICYAQWEDCGPFETDNWEYVFGDNRPATSGNGGAGLDVSPAVRDYLGFRYSARCDWRFVEHYEVPDGPWKTWGNNNPFALRNPGGENSEGESSDTISLLKSIRDKIVQTEAEGN